MDAGEIAAAGSAGILPVIEGVDPTTARMVGDCLAVGGRVVMPLDGVAWSLDRTSDIEILDELGMSLGTLCLAFARPARPLQELTRYEYAALLADASGPEVLIGPVQPSRAYAVIEEAEFGRYVSHYLTGSALWGGFNHGTVPPTGSGDVTSIRARRDVLAPTPHHVSSFRLLTRATGPRDQFLRTYHALELLFDYVTYRKFVKAGNDLVDFGRIMSAYQRAELARLKGLVQDFCQDFDAIAGQMEKLEPHLNRAEDMFQVHGKDGNPLAEERWTAFRAVVEAGPVGRAALSTAKLAKNDAAFTELMTSVAAYQIYRMRSSIAHSRIGEYLLTDADDAMIAEFGLPLIQEVTGQVFSSPALASLII
jgi:hypothetical protein